MGNSDVGTVGPGARHTNPAPIFSATQRALVRHRPPVTTMSAPSRAVMKDREMASSSNCFFHAATTFIILKSCPSASIFWTWGCSMIPVSSPSMRRHGSPISSTSGLRRSSVAMTTLCPRDCRVKPRTTKGCTSPRVPIDTIAIRFLAPPPAELRTSGGPAMSESASMRAALPPLPGVTTRAFGKLQYRLYCSPCLL